MATRNGVGPFPRLELPIAVEFAVVTTALVGLYSWQRVVTTALSAVFGAPPWFGGVLVDGLVSGGVFVAGLGLFTLAYAAARDIDVGLAFPARTDASLVVLAGAAPVALVGLTKLVGALTGVPYNSLTMTAYAAGAPLVPVVTVAGLGLFVAIPTLVLVCQVLVQGSFERVVGGDVAAVLTTLVAGFVMMSDTGGLATVPDVGKLVGVVLFTLALGVATYATEHVASERLRHVAYVPLLSVVALVVLSGVAGVESVAGGLFVVTHLAVLGVAACAYGRTRSLLVPALAYAGLLLANRTVVFLFEAGLRSW